MKRGDYIPSVVDFAYEIIDLHRENMELRRQLDHHKELEKIHLDSLDNSDKHHKEFLGIILGATLDPDSTLNRGNAALIREEASK